MAITPFTSSGDPFERLVDAFLAPGPSGRTRGGGLLRGPATDVVETETEIRVVVDLPGFEAEDVEVDLENNLLTLRGEKRERREEGDENTTWHLVERRFGQFSRSFVLPRDIEQDRIAAGFENGVLTVTIPKNEKAQRRRISIDSGGDRRKELVQESEPPAGTE
jgi:HSP20 family protein